MKADTLPAMRLPAVLPALSVLLVACGPAAGPTRPEGPIAAPASAPAPAEAPPASIPVAAPPAPPAEAIDERFAATRDGWRVDYHLQLPALPAETSRRLRRACTAWLFQGLAEPRPDVEASGEAALATLIADGGKPLGDEPWYSERAVVATHQGGGWLALKRSERSFAGGAHPNQRVEGLIIELGKEVSALTIDEIIPPERQAGVRLQLAAGIRASRQLPADGPLTSEIASDAELPIPVPLLSADGARFVWNAYEIAPYSDGPYEVLLPAAQLAGVLAAEPWATPPPAP